jgi:chitodextrinase
MTAKLRAELKSENATDFPDNTAGLISAGDLRGQLDDIIDSATFPEDGGGGGGGTTIDTGEPYKIVMLSNGTVRAIPVTAIPPIAPTGMSVVVRLASVSVSWLAVTGAVRFNIYRNDVFLSETTSLNFRDTNVVIDNTYEYKVSSIDQYGQISPRSEPVSATPALSLNHAPTDVVITCWPTPISTDGPTFVRVNALELDAQDMSFLLNIDAGSLRATNDPSLWIITL